VALSVAYERAGFLGKMGIMKLGLFGMHMGLYVEPDALASVAVTAEEAGFDSLWASEHVVLPDPQSILVGAFGRHTPAPPSPAQVDCTPSMTSAPGTSGDENIFGQSRTSFSESYRISPPFQVAGS
jgi:hypothetical protein